MGYIRFGAFRVTLFHFFSFQSAPSFGEIVSNSLFKILRVFRALNGVALFLKKHTIVVAKNNFTPSYRL